MRSMTSRQWLLAAMLLLALCTLGVVGVDVDDVNDDSTSSPIAMVEVGESVSWRNRPPHRHGWGHRSIRAERDALYERRRVDANYQHNLDEFNRRLEKSYGPASPHQVLQKIEQQHQTNVGLQRDNVGALTREVSAATAAVESEAAKYRPLQVHHHVDSRKPMSRDLLLGRGFYNAANREATNRGLRNHAASHPPQPSMAELPPVQVGMMQEKEHSFVVKATNMRQPYEGPTMSTPPPVDYRQEPHALQRPLQPGASIAGAPKLPPPQQQSVQSQAMNDNAAEAEFLAGLPQEFMELDAATQVQILTIVDQRLHGAPQTQQQQPQQQQQQQQRVMAATARPVQSKTRKAKRAVAVKQQRARSPSAVDESELASASSALKALAELHQTTHVPVAKLIHLLAGKKNE